MEQIKEKIWNKNFIIACFANFFVACSFSLLMPTMPIYLTNELHVGNSQVGIVLSSYALALLVIRPFCGYWVDVYSRKPLLLLGVSLFVFAFFGYYFATGIVFLIILRFVHGLFWGLTTVSSNTVAIDIVPASRRAEGIGYFGVNTNIAMALAPFIGVYIYDKFGFDVLITSGIVMGFLAIIVICFIEIPLREKLDKIPALSFDRFLLKSGIPIFFNQLFIAFGWGTLMGFATLYGKEIGIENVGIFFLFLAGGIVLSRVTSGKFVDKGFIHQIMVIALILIAISFVAFATLHSIYAFCISAFMIGVGYGTLFPALQTIYINMAPASKRGTANSTYLTSFDLGIGIGMLLGANFADYFGYSNMYLITAGLCILAVAIYWFNSRKVYDRNKLA